jgi:hypothetical protein
MQIIGGASGEILDRFDAVLAQCDQHRRADPVNFAQRGLDAQFPAPGCERVPGAIGGSARLLHWDRLRSLSQPREHGCRIWLSHPILTPGRRKWCLAVHPKAGSRSGRDRRSRNVTQSPLNDQGEQRRNVLRCLAARDHRWHC